MQNDDAHPSNSALPRSTTTKATMLSWRRQPKSRSQACTSSMNASTENWCSQVTLEHQFQLRYHYKRPPLSSALASTPSSSISLPSSSHQTTISSAIYSLFAPRRPNCSYPGSSCSPLAQTTPPHESSNLSLRKGRLINDAAARAATSDHEDSQRSIIGGWRRQKRRNLSTVTHIHNHTHTIIHTHCMFSEVELRATSSRVPSLFIRFRFFIHPRRRVPCNHELDEDRLFSSALPIIVLSSSVIFLAYSAPLPQKSYNWREMKKVRLEKTSNFSLFGLLATLKLTRLDGNIIALTFLSISTNGVFLSYAFLIPNFGLRTIRTFFCSIVINIFE